MTSFPLIEAFGPTVQGEGALAGSMTYFLRFGGCDYRCSWCDSMYAVEPALVREHAEKHTTEQLVALLNDLRAAGGPAEWVTFSGGNPALFDLGPLVAELQGPHGWKVAVETQGSIWRPWLREVAMLTISPKPPSSGMFTYKHIKQTTRFMEEATRSTWDGARCLKFVVFDDADLEFARVFTAECVAADERLASAIYLSAGTDQPTEAEEPYVHLSSWQEQFRLRILDRYRWLCEAVVGDPVFAGAKVLPQLHALCWGHRRGV